jgi:hypothetical protein
VKFICGIPGSTDEFLRLWDLEQEQFGDLSVSAAVARQIFDARPEVFCTITDSNQAVAAYSIAYPLKPQWAQAMIAGEITEADLTADMLLSRQDDHEGACIYIGSVFVSKEYDVLTKIVLLSNLLSWRIQQLHDVSLKRLSVIMMPVSKQGEQLIQFIGARKLNDGASRKDSYPIYERRISGRLLFRAIQAIERFCDRRTVDINLDFGLDRGARI